MPQGPTIEAVISGCCKGNRESQQELYKQFYGLSMGICNRYCAEEADLVELVNDGFLKVFRNIQKFTPQLSDPADSLRAWIKRIMINTALDHCRKVNKMHTVRELDEVHYNIAQVGETATDHLSYKDLLKLIHQLPPVYKTVFNLHVIDGYTHEEIARMLGINQGTSKSNLFKARALLRKLIKESEPVNYEQRAI